MHGSRLVLFATMMISLALPSRATAAFNDWVEGTAAADDGATRDFYNRAARLGWTSYMGDWSDAQNAPQGTNAYSTVNVTDDDTAKWVEWDVTSLVSQWRAGSYQNQGFFLRGLAGSGSFRFRSREHAVPAERPQLVVTTSAGAATLSPVADTYLEPSTYQCMGDTDTLRVTKDSNNALLRFDLSAVSGSVTSAQLRLYSYAQYGGSSLDIGVFRCSQGHDLPPSKPIYGIAAQYPDDVGIGGDPDVYMFSGFETASWTDDWSTTGGTHATVATDPALKLVPLSGKALRVELAASTHTALPISYKFAKETGSEPEEVYFRYYLRFADDWNQTVDGGKMPGISGTYGVAGWGGRPSDGTNGWSARGSFHETIQGPNPLAGMNPIGTYCYHADMTGDYGNIWLWQRDYRGYIPNNEWRSVEQYLKMNTPTQKDGVIRAWVDGRLAFEKTDIRFRDVTTLKIEQIWMNIYHGGTAASPPYDQHVYIDNVVIAKKYIGPIYDGKTPLDAGPDGAHDAGAGDGSTPGDAAGDSTGQDGAAPSDGSSSESQSADTGTHEALDGGCGCGVHAGARAAPALLLLLSLLVSLRRRT